MNKDWAREKVEHCSVKAFDGMGNIVLAETAIHILRLERARARRVVRSMKVKDAGNNYSLGYNKACDELLRMLK